MFTGAKQANKLVGPIQFSKVTDRVPIGINKIVHIDTSKLLEYFTVVFSTGMVQLFSTNDSKLQVII